jgi:F-type H+-transporting ATPase subunit a
MHEQLWFTAFLNKYFAWLGNALLEVVGLHAHDPRYPFADFVAMQILVAAILLVFFLLVRMKLSVEKPGGIQHLAEMIQEMIVGQARDIIGHHYKRYVPYIVTLGLFIVSCNLIGLIPGFLSPTQFPYVPLGCAIATFIYYHFHGFREQGVLNYIKHFAGPVWELPIPMLLVMVPLMFLIEVISHFARLMSLTIRLYANMFAGEMVTLAFFSLIPILVPVLFLGLHLGVALLQAYIFILLTMIYLGLATAEEH